ncbi:MAG: Zn(2+)-responsive transcriptional regulator [Nitrospirae bacterium]|nr:Zn(2+)-responsive transcriptional regulator [Nitrospirota bacterium]
MKPSTIGWLAREAGVRVDTIRYYERRGLIPPPSRRDSGYREYTDEDLARVRFIRRAKDLGFSLTEIAELLNLRVDRRKTCADVKREAERKIAQIDQRIAELKRMRHALNDLAAACQGRGPTSECPILDSFDQKSGNRKEKSR